MENDEAFAKRLAAIHRLGDTYNPESDPLARHGESPMDVHREELRAMFETFLPNQYRPDEFERVARLQGALHMFQAAMLAYLETGAIGAEWYVDSVNYMIRLTFQQCAEILGQKH